MPRPLSHAATADLRRGKLVSRARLDLIRPRRQQRFDTPCVDDHDELRRKRVDGLAKPGLDARAVPARFVKRDGLTGADQLIGEASNAPAGVAGKEMLHLVASAGQELRQLGRMLVPATVARPFEKEALDGDADRLVRRPGRSGLRAQETSGRVAGGVMRPAPSAGAVAGGVMRPRLALARPRVGS
jgi:hypothetical protein